MMFQKYASGAGTNMPLPQSPTDKKASDNPKIIYQVSDGETKAADTQKQSLSDMKLDTPEAIQNGQRYISESLDQPLPTQEQMDADVEQILAGADVPPPGANPTDEEIALAKKQNMQRMHDFRSKILDAIPTLSDEELERVRINSFLAVVSLDYFPTITTAVQAWDPVALSQAIQLHDEIRTAAIDEQFRRKNQ